MHGRRLFMLFLSNSFVYIIFHCRCGCLEKCRKKILTIWPQKTNIQKRKNKKKAIQHAFFSFLPYCKVFSYHVLYSESDLVADIGGYLGLFLGLSVFGLVELLEKTILENKNINTSRSLSMKSFR